MKKKVIALSCLLSLVLFFLIRGTDMYKYHDDWAMYNYGQTVKGADSQAGIDINYRNMDALKKKNATVTKIAVVDSGVYNQKDAPYIDNLRAGWDFYNDDATIYDAYSLDYHGTYVTNKIYEICKSISIVPVKFLSGTKGSSKDCVKAVSYAISHGVKIINCSWSFETDQIDLRKLIETNPDIIFVVAAGNHGVNLDSTKLYPVNYQYENVITVGAMDATGKGTDISGYGKSVDIFAPGENVKILLPDNDTGFIDGTSIATAFVTGTVANIFSLYPDMPPKMIKKVLNQSAKKGKYLKGKCKSEGYLDVYGALRAAGGYYEKGNK